MSLSGIVYCKYLCTLCLVCVGFCTHLLIVLFSGVFYYYTAPLETQVFALLRLTSLPPVPPLTHSHKQNTTLIVSNGHNVAAMKGELRLSDIEFMILTVQKNLVRSEV